MRREKLKKMKREKGILENWEWGKVNGREYSVMGSRGTGDLKNRDGRGGWENRERRVVWKSRSGGKRKGGKGV